MLGNRILGKPLKRFDDFRRAHAGGARVPYRERRHAISVNVFRRLDQFGEARQSIAGLLIARAGHFHQNGVIALYDQRIVSLVIGHWG